jgi:release factor glutamine methyltransferase
LDAQVLLAHIFDRSRTWVIAHPEAPLTQGQLKELKPAIERLERSEPLPYVIGHWEFFGLEFRVTPAVLIPRPETELLVESALDWLREHPRRRFAVDIGTGSGCIAISLAVNLPDLTIIASDISLRSLQVAKQNICIHRVETQVLPIVAQLFPPSRERFDLISANLPYIPTQRLRGLKIFDREPALALDGGSDGLDLIQQLLVDAHPNLNAGGLLLLEIDSTQGKILKKLAQEAFPSADVRILADLAGRDRLMHIAT